MPVKTSETIPVFSMQQTVENNTVEVTAQKKRPDHLWKPGESGNPGGKRKNDRAAEIAYNIFNNHGDFIGQKMLEGFNSGDRTNVYKALADRAFGKIPENINVSGVVDLALHLSQARQLGRIADADSDDSDVMNSPLISQHDIIDVADENDHNNSSVNPPSINNTNK